MMSGEFEEQGFRLVRQAIPSAEVQRLRDAIMAWEASSTNAPETEYGLLRHDTWRGIAALAQTVHAGLLAQLACETLGRDRLRLFQDVIVWKTANASEHLLWHQDYAYWPLDRPDGVVLWLALDPADRDNGGLRVAAGSHRAPTFSPPSAPSDVSDRSFIDLEVEPGDAVLLHPLIWHSSPPLRTAERRIAWITTWIDVDARWDLMRTNHPFRYTLEPEDGSQVSGVRFPVFERTDAAEPMTG